MYQAFFNKKPLCIVCRNELGKIMTKYSEVIEKTFLLVSQAAYDLSSARPSCKQESRKHNSNQKTKDDAPISK